MRNAIGVSLFVMGLVLACHWAVGAGPDKASAPPVQLDPAKLETWGPAATQAQDQIERVTKELIAIAKDEKRARPERRSAILLLGKVRIPAAVEYLVANISLVMPTDVLGDTEMPLLTPCLYALNGTKDWNVVGAVLRDLDNEKNVSDQMHFAILLRDVLGSDRAIALIDYERKASKNDVRTKNLEGMRKCLVEK